MRLKKLVNAIALFTMFAGQCRSTVAQAASGNGSVPVLPHDASVLSPVTAEDLEKTRRGHVEAQLGPDGLRSYKAAASDKDKNALFDQAMMKGAMEGRAKLDNPPPPKKHWIINFDWNFAKQYGDTSSKYVIFLNSALDNEAVRSRPVVQQFIQQHQGKLEKLSPLLLTELELRTLAAYLEQPEGLTVPAWVALNPRPEFKTHALRLFFESQEAYDAFLSSHNSPERMAQGTREVMLAFCYRNFASSGMQTWGAPEVSHRLVGDLQYDKSFTWPLADQGAGDVAVMFGTEGSKLFNAGSDGLGPTPTSTAEQNANRLRLFTAAQVFRDAIEFTYVEILPSTQ